MKKLLLIIVTMAFYSGIMAQSGAIKINPFGLLFGSLNAGYEHVLNEKSTVEGGLSYFSAKATVNGEDDVKLNGVGFYAMYRWYFGKKDAPRGLYLAPNFGFNSTSGKGGGEKASTNLLKIGAFFGNQWVFGEDGGFVLDLAIGAANYSFKTNDNISGFNLDGVGPQIRIAIGYAF